MQYISIMIAWIAPLLILLLLAPFSQEIDIAFAQKLYQEGFWDPIPFKLLYNYGFWPANIVGFGSGALFVASFFAKTLLPWRRLFLYLALVLALGSGLIVHGVLKDHWGRPRPRQITEFGGKLEYAPFWKPDFYTKESRKSFVSGHASTGFFFFALGFAAWHYSRRRWAYFWFAFALTLGFSLGLARMAQGGHFFTDIIGAGVVMWYISLALLPLLRKKLVQV